jgi:hypothetical protein
MKNLNESQMIIFEQEAGRALMLKNAKEVLVEDVYQELRRILPLYEEMADKKGISRMELYEFFSKETSDPSKNNDGIFKSLYKGFRSKARKFAERNKSSEEIVDAIEQIMQNEATVALFNSLEDYKNMTADELKNDPKYKGIKTRADAVIRRTQYLFLLLGKMDPLLRGRDAAEALADMAGTLGMDPKDLMDRYVLGIRGARSAATQAGVDAAKVGGSGGDGGGTGGGEGGNIPDSDPVTTPEEEGEDISPSTEPTTSGDGDGRGRVLTVRSVQRPIINLVQRVAAAQNIDVTVKQAQEIAIMITKNLVNQMRANGVEFKGVTKDLKESFISQIEDILKEASSLSDYSNWMKIAKEAIEKFEDLGFTSKKVIRQMKDTDNDDNFVDMYDLYLDLRKIRSAGRKAKAALNRDTSATSETKNDFDNLKRSINTRITQMQIYSEFSEPVAGKAYKKRYVQAKKKMKGMVQQDNTQEKDLTMSTPTSGQINISKTVAKAIQKGGLSRDDAQKLTPILMKKIQKIIAKELGADVKYLEEKINRYVSTVLKEIKR